MHKKTKDEFCGLASYRPQWLQKFANCSWFTIFSCLIILTQGLYFGYTIGVLTTIEKRFRVTSLRSGSLLSSYDVGHSITVLLIGHYGPWLHKPKWIGLGAFCNALICFGLASTHFLFKNDEINNDAHFDLPLFGSSSKELKLEAPKTELCHQNKIFDTHLNMSTRNNTDLLVDSSSAYNGDWWAFAVLIFLQFLCGINSSPFTTLTYVYIDDNASQKRSSFYFGLLTAMWGYGPAFGFGLAAICTQIYVTLADPPMNLTTSSVHWLGAWWLGYLFLGLAYSVTALPFFCYPASLKHSRQVKIVVGECDEKNNDQLDRVETLVLDPFSNVASDYDDLSKGDDMKKSINWFFTHLAKIPRQICKLLKNKIFVCVTGSWIFWSYVIGGYSTFLPKYIEVHFHQPSHIASTYGGLLAALGAATACAIGGKLLSIFNPRPHKSMLLLALCTLSALFSYLIFIFVDCPGPAILGIDSKLNNSSCHADCACEMDHYEPVCAGQQVYFSPCIAGCHFINGTNENIFYDSCSCSSKPIAKPGICLDNCHLKMITYLVGTFLAGIVANLFQVAQFTTLIKSVIPEDKSMSYALANFFTGIIGFIPSQVLYGKVIDTTCSRWNSNTAKMGGNEHSNCQIYNSNLFRSRYHLLTSFFTFGTFVCISLCSYFARKFSFYL